MYIIHTYKNGTKMLEFDTSYVNHKANKSNIIKKYQKIVTNIHRKINNKTALGCEMTG